MDVTSLEIPQDTPRLMLTLCNCPSTGQMHIPTCPIYILQDLKFELYNLKMEVRELKEILIPYKEDCQAKSEGGDD